VLEPSPPAVLDEPWFADDPTERGELPAGRRLVSPVTTGDVLWDELAADDPDLAAWCAERWLAAHRRLEPSPPTLGMTREALHILAAHAISPCRQRANGRMGLRWTLGGFGTPYFGADAQLRVEGAELLIGCNGGERRERIGTLARAVEAIGFELSEQDEHLRRTPLEVDPVASHFIGDWFGFATSVLEQLRAESPPEWEPSRVQIWPEHFDAAVEIGSESAERRAAVGASPGDDQHAEPYLYIAPWIPRPGHGLTELSYRELLEAGDQREAALEFFRLGLRARGA
jgi:hypothetical protein